MEPQAGIIRKGREVAYGHKLNLTTGRSGLIFDLVIEAGNPADSENADQLRPLFCGELSARRLPFGDYRAACQRKSGSCGA